MSQRLFSRFCLLGMAMFLLPSIAQSAPEHAYLTEDTWWRFRVGRLLTSGQIDKVTKSNKGVVRVRFSKERDFRNLQILQSGPGPSLVRVELRFRDNLWEECTGALTHHGTHIAGICSASPTIPWTAMPQAIDNRTQEDEAALQHDIELLRNRERTLKGELREAKNTISELRSAPQPTRQLDSRDAQLFADRSSSRLYGRGECPANSAADCGRADQVIQLRAPRVARTGDDWVEAMLELQIASIVALTGERGAERVIDKEAQACRGEYELCRVGIRQQVINSAVWELTKK